MKRFGILFDSICDFENLLLAARKAYRGKKKNSRVAEFYFHAENELLLIQNDLMNGMYLPSVYRTFYVHEPKRRLICAADFRDRVVHHAICNVIEPILEKRLIHDTYACRKGKGSHKAILRAQAFMRKNHYYFKSDIAKFFQSVDHIVLKQLGAVNRILQFRYLIY